MQTTSTTTTAIIRNRIVTVSIMDTTYSNGQRALTIWKNEGQRGKFSGIHNFLVENGTVHPQRLADAPKFAAQTVRDYLGGTR